MGMFSTNSPTMRIGTCRGGISTRSGIGTGSWEVCVSSRSSWIPLPVSPPFGAPEHFGRKFTSSTKASVIIYFTKNSSNDCLRIDPQSDFIRQLSRYRQPLSKGPKWNAWKNNILVTRALKGSSIAAVSLYNNPTPLHVFYQDSELHVRHIFMRTLYRDDGARTRSDGPSREWYHGE